HGARGGAPRSGDDRAHALRRAAPRRILGAAGDRPGGGALVPGHRGRAQPEDGLSLVRARSGGAKPQESLGSLELVPGVVLEWGPGAELRSWTPQAGSCRAVPLELARPFFTGSLGVARGPDSD